MIYLKKFITHIDYNVYINGQNKILPNVSYCEDDNDVHYNPWTDPRIIAKFNIIDTSTDTQIIGQSGTSQFTEIEIDNVVQLSVVETYTFDTIGEHTVKYTLSDNTIIAGNYNVRNSKYTKGFYNCKNLISITIPNSVISIGDYTFYMCTGLTSINIPNSVTSIGKGAFRSCTGLTNATIPNSVTTIGDYAFCFCNGITSITIPDSVTSIGLYAFFECINLTSVTIGNGVTTISQQAFASCIGLTSITIPTGVTSIGYGAFSGCTNLISVTVKATTPPTLSNNVFANNASGRKIYVPASSVDDYKAASDWSNYASYIEAIP